MSPAFLACVNETLDDFEKGYQRDPNDRGNWTGGAVGAGVLIGTNRGISAPVLAAWRKTPCTEADMRALTREEALAIYEQRYWIPLHGDDLPLPLAYVCFDAEVMSGMGNATLHKHRTVAWLQGALGVQIDDQLGPVTLSSASVCADVAGAVREFCRRRLAFLQADPDWAHFGRGWQRRCERIEAMALALIHPAAAPAAGAAP